MGSVQDVASYYYPANTEWGDLLGAYDGYAITYDQIGNPLSDRYWNYTWEHGRQLASMTATSANTNPATITYTYDANGIRTGKTVVLAGQTKTYSYVYTGGKLMQEVVVTTTATNTTTNTIRYYYDGNGKPVAILWDTLLFYFVTNMQGDVVALVYETGEAVVTYTYDAWGNLLTTGGVLAATLGQYNSLRYRSYVYDTETKLYYLQSRYYNPEMGRFINADVFVATGQGILGNNMFAYCNNQPVNYWDPCGTCPHDPYFLGLADCPICRKENGASAFKRYMNRLYDLRASQDNLNQQILQEQVDTFSNSIEWIIKANEKQQEFNRQIEQEKYGIVRDFIIDRFSTPEKASRTLSGVAILLEGAQYALEGTVLAGPVKLLKYLCTVAALGLSIIGEEN